LSKDGPIVGPYNVIEPGSPGTAAGESNGIEM
jgi:hypothetical protein